MRLSIIFLATNLCAFASVSFAAEPTKQSPSNNSATAYCQTFLGTSSAAETPMQEVTRIFRNARPFKDEYETTAAFKARMENLVGQAQKIVREKTGRDEFVFYKVIDSTIVRYVAVRARSSPHGGLFTSFRSGRPLT